MPRGSRSRSRARWVPTLALLLVALVAVLIIVVSAGSATTIGDDVSYPQCSHSYPSHPLFGIVGVNGGRADTANPCLATELSWARAAPGQTRPGQPRLSLYINTGNPGTHVPDWPQAGSTPADGVCNGLLTNACSYLYGEQRSTDAYRLVAARDPSGARTAPWWLDVELLNSWAGTYELNIAALRGFIAGLIAAGAKGPVGIYSTAAQWKDLTGLAAQSTASTFGRKLPAWVAGSEGTPTLARQNCGSGGFTGVAPTLAQYRIGSRDADLRCSGTTDH